MRRLSLQRFHDPTPRFPPRGPGGPVPALPRYYQGATTSCRPSRRASLPSLGGTTRCVLAFAPTAPKRNGGGPGVPSLRRPPETDWSGGDDRISQVPGRPPVLLCPVLRLRQDGTPL